MRTANPALHGNIFTETHAETQSQAMTVGGTVNKTLLLVAFAILAASYAWSRPDIFMPLVIPLVIAGLVLALITIFAKKAAALTAPLYAIVEGLVLGAISLFFERQYPGIAVQAAFLTLGVLLSMLLAWRTGLIKVTQKFRLGLIAVTGGIFLLYMINLIMHFFGGGFTFIHSSGPLGIGFSIFVVIIAALNLVLDFDFIARGAQHNAPKYLEWYGAFGLLVTLVWLYIEILRLLAKLRSR